MGWFLTQRSRGGGRSKRGGSGGVAGWWDRQHTVLTVKLGLSLAAVSLAGVGWVASKGWLKDYVRRTHSQRIEAGDVTLIDVPRAWHTKATLDRLRRRAAKPIAADPLNNASLGRSVEALEADPIVRSAQVKRGHGGRIRVEASYRLPTAIIEARDGYYLVDDAGRRLSLYPYGRYQLDKGPLDRLPVIRRVDTAPPRDPGHRWDSEPVQAALSLIGLLRGELRPDLMRQVDAIDPTHRDSRGRIRLAIVTREGRIEWGFPPGKERGIDQRPTVKLDRLQRLAGRYDGQLVPAGHLARIAGPRLRLRELEVQNVQRP